jgi:hypothetical protein
MQHVLTPLRRIMRPTNQTGGIFAGSGWARKKDWQPLFTFLGFALIINVDPHVMTDPT